MKNYTIKLFYFLLLIVSIKCSGQSSTSNIDTMDNELILEIYQKDLEIRQLDALTDTVHLETYDSKHRELIFELLAKNMVKTARDKIRAAWILQHTAAKICSGELTSISPENYLLAYKLSSSALAQLERENDTATIRKESIRRIIALNYDRYLLFSHGYQMFGTQFVFDEESGEMVLAPIDTNLISDQERMLHNVEALPVLLSKYKMKPMSVR